MFPIEMFKDFSEWLMSPDGKLRSDTTAREVCIDVSKRLKYLHPKSMTFDCLLIRLAESMKACPHPDVNAIKAPVH